MSLALVLGGMTLAALLLLLLPLLRPRPAASRRGFELEVYRDQLQEIERDRARGLIDEAAARAARTEIERRLLQAGRSSAVPAAPSAPSRRLGVALALALLLPGFAIGLYLQLGAPHLTDQPLHARTTEPADPRMLALVERLERRLAEAPDDRQAWVLLGHSRQALGQSREAALALRRALDLDPADPAVLTLLGEVLVGAAAGVVGTEAQGLFARALALDPHAPEPRYYQGLAAAQAGDLQGALGAWREVLMLAPADAPWRPQVEAQFQGVAVELGYDGRALLAELAPPAAPARGPGAGDVARAAEMSPEARAAMVRSMVDGLAARLEDEPGDLEGWLRLARARMVLGEPDAAFLAYERARALEPDDAEIVKAYADARLVPPAEPDGMPEVTEAAAALDAQAAALAPTDPEPHWYLGLHALQLGDRAQALEHWRKVLALLDPEHPDYDLLRGQLEAIAPGR